MRASQETADDALAQGLRQLSAQIYEAESLLRARPGVEPADLAEGYLSLAGMIAATLRRTLAATDGRRPRFFQLADDISRGAFSNPDNHIYAAVIEGGGAYRVVGWKTGCVDVTLEVLNGLGGYDVSGQRGLASIDTPDLVTDADGRFEVWIGGEPRANNWMPSPADANTVTLRLTLGDWEGPVPVAPRIERVDAAGAETPYRRPTAADVAAKLAEAGQRLVDRVRASGDFVERWSASLPVNAFAAPAVRGGDYRPSQVNTMCRFRIASGDAMIIETRPVQATYASLVVGDLCWFESFDLQNVQSSLTYEQSRLSADGVYRYVVCGEDPGAPNWLSTAAHEAGMIFIRWQGVLGPAPETPAIRIVPIAEVFDHLPAGEPRIASEQRLAALSQRRQRVHRRFP